MILGFGTIAGIGVHIPSGFLHRIKRWIVLAVALSVATGAASADEPKTTLSSEPKNVLVLNSYHKGFVWSDDVVHGIEETIVNSLQPIDLWVEYMDTKRFPDPAHLTDLATVFERKYRDKEIDAIVASDNNALNFLLTHRDRLFPGIPVVFCGINWFDPEMLRDHRGITGVAEHGDFEATIHLIRQLHPEVKSVIIILPDTVTGLEDRELINTYLDRLSAMVQVDIWQGLPIEDSEARVATLPKGSAVIIGGVAKSRRGRVLTNAEKARRITTASPVPVYGIRKIVLGHGVVGGKMIDGFVHGETAAHLVLDVLEGKPADEIPVQTESPNRFLFDAVVLSKFGIQENSLPPGSIVINLAQTAYERFRTFMAVAILIVLGLGIFIGLLIFNIAQRRWAEQALRESEERLRTLIEHSPEAIYLKDIEGHYLVANGEYRNRYNVAQDQVIGKKASDVLPADLAAMVKEQDEEVFSRKKECRWELDIAHADGSVHTHMLVKFPMFDAKGNLSGLGCVSTDISDIKHANEAARVLQIELAHVSRLSTMGEMAASFAHELNQPLAAIGNFAAGSLRRLRGVQGEAAQVIPALEKISEQAQRAGSIIKNIRLFVGKKDEQRIDGELPEIDLNQAIRGAAGLVGNDALHNNTVLRLNLSPAFPPVQGDTIQIQQVIVNLARNAIEAMREADSIQRDLTIRTGVTPDGDAEIRVLDTGPGIPDEVLTSLFEPFFTTKKSGMGMGLSICRSIIESHGGKMTASNRARGGAEFKVTLPASTADVETHFADAPAEDIRADM